MAGIEVCAVAGMELGVEIDASTLNAPLVTLYALGENTGASLSGHLLRICETLRARHLPKISLGDIQWKIRNGVFNSTLGFDEKNGLLYRIRMSDSNVFWDQNDPLTLEDYRRPSMLPGGSSLTILTVPSKQHPEGYVFFEQTDAHAEVAIVDPDKFMRLWHRASPGQILRTTPALTEAFSKKSLLSSSIRHPMKLGRFNCHRSDSRLHASFVNGTHRTTNLYNLGAPFIPLEVSAEEKPLLMELAGHEAFQARAQGSKIKKLLSRFGL